MTMPVVAIVGRANVGKSTLVNRLIGRRAAIEHAEPGVTRDRQGFPMRWRGSEFTLVDTGGWEPRAKGLAAKVVAQAERAAAEADLIVMVLDVQTGLTDDDLAVAKRLRRVDLPVLVVANKVDHATAELELGALERLGLGPALPVSALHGRGSGDLLDVIVEHVAGIERAAEAADDVVAVAIVGRPNVGKSSLFNALVGDERAIVHEEPGTTRDAVDTVAEVAGTRYRFVDTAGMRKRGKEASGPEYYGLVRSLRAIDAAHVALHVVDATEAPTQQDQRIARRIADAGAAAVVVLNKWDLIEAEQVEQVEVITADELRFVRWAPVVRTSALTGRGLGKVVPTIERVHHAWDQRVPTAALNTWLREVTETVPMGSTQRGRPSKVRYITQTGVRPPTFVLFANGTIQTSAMRALENRLRARFGFEGTPIRLAVRRPKRKTG